MNLKVLRNFLLQYGLFLFLIITTLSSILYFSLDKTYFKNILNKEEYASKVYLSIIDEMKNYLNSSGFDESVLKDIFTVSDVNNELLKKIETIDTPSKNTLDTTFIKENLQNNINTYLKEKNLTASTDSLTKFIEQIVSVYESEINLYGYSNIVIKTIKQAKKYNNILLPISIFITLIFLSLNIIFCKKESLNVCFLATFLFLLFISFYIKKKIDIEHIYLFNQVFSDFLKTYLLNFLQLINYGCLPFLLLSIISFIFSQKRQEKWFFVFFVIFFLICCILSY